MLTQSERADRLREKAALCRRLADDLPPYEQEAKAKMLIMADALDADALIHRSDLSGGTESMP